MSRCLEKDPRDRYPDLRKILTELESLDLPAGCVPRRHTDQTGVRRAATGARPERRRVRHALATAAIAALAMVTLFLVPRLDVLTSPSDTAPTDTMDEVPSMPAQPVQAQPVPTQPVQAQTPDVEPIVALTQPLETAGQALFNDSPVEGPQNVEISDLFDSIESDRSVASLPTEEPEITDLPETAEASLPAEPPAVTTPPAPSVTARGLLVLDAQPWAMLTSVVADDGRVYAPARNSGQYTPLVVALPVGSYIVTLTHPAMGERPCKLEVTAGGNATCQELFHRVEAKDFFRATHLGDRGPDPLALASNGFGSLAALPSGDGGGGGDGGRSGGKSGKNGGKSGGGHRGGGGGKGGGGGGSPATLSFSLGGGMRDANGSSFGPPRPRISMPPKWVRKAAQAFFDGDYEKTAAAVEAKKARTREATFFARLFLGASLHARFLTGGEADAELVHAAVVNLRECRRDFPTFAPLPEFFSPRFIEFYSVYATPADVAEG